MTASAAAPVLTESSGGVRYLRLNKAAKLNALDHQMLRAIEQSIDEWEREPGASVLVVGSTSARAFCAGADIDVLSEMNATNMQEWELLGNRVLDRLQFSPLISIAAIPGYCFGGGCTLAMACDFRFCSRNAAFAQPEIELGWIPGWGGVARLQRVAGHTTTRDLCLTGMRLDAEEAQRRGLVDRVCEPEGLAGQVDAMAGDLARRSPMALRTIKELLFKSGPQWDPAAHRFDALANSALLAQDSSQAAIAAFREKAQAKSAQRK